MKCNWLSVICDVCYLRFNTVSSCENMVAIDQCAATNVNGFLGIFLQNGHLPWIFAKFAVTIDIHWILDTTGNAVRVSAATLSWLLLMTELRWWWWKRLSDWSTTAHLLRSTLLRNRVEWLTLQMTNRNDQMIKKIKSIRKIGLLEEQSWQAKILRKHSNAFAH